MFPQSEIFCIFGLIHALIPSLPQAWTKFAPLVSSNSTDKLHKHSFVKEPKNFFQVLFWAQVSQSCCPQRWIVFETSPSSCSRCRLSLKYSLLQQQFLSHFCTSSCLFVEGVQTCCVRAPFQKQMLYHLNKTSEPQDLLVLQISHPHFIRLCPSEQKVTSLR